MGLVSVGLAAGRAEVVLNLYLTRYSENLVSDNKFYGGDFNEATAGGNLTIDCIA